MRLPRRDGRSFELCYGQNVHAVESADEVIDALTTHAARVFALLRATDAGLEPAVGLRLSAAAARRFERDRKTLDRLVSVLASLGAGVSTVNAFPHGDFQVDGLKSSVYRPDWHDRERLDYTLGAARVLTQLPTRTSYRSISTSPGSFRRFGPPRRDLLAANMARAAAGLHRLHQENAASIVVLAIEPEPGCTFSTTDELIRFFEDDLLRARPAELDALAPGRRAAQEAVLRQHVGVCFDVCHAAVEYEDPRAALGRLEAAGIMVAKVQASAALHLDEPQRNDMGRARLAEFDEPRFLHQVSARRRDGSIDRFDDLPEFLTTATTVDYESARSHFHVPVFLDDLGCGLRATSTELEQALVQLRRRGLTEHVEIETYSWAAMPERRCESGDDADLAADIVREHVWVRDRLA